MKLDAKPGYTVAPAVAPPICREGEVLLIVEAASICGTDLHIWNWDDWASHRVVPPRIMGHEMAGTIAQLGPGVTGFEIGTRAAVESHVVCGACGPCRSGRSHVCERTRILGVDTDGVFASQVVVPAVNLHPVPPSVAPEVAAFMEPLGNAVHSCQPHQMEGKSVAILGCGPIGCAAVAVARAQGAASVVAVDPNPFRLSLAEAMGATSCVQDAGELAADSHTAAPDIVLEMSGAPAAVANALRLVVPGGAVSLLGLGPPLSLDVAADIVMRGITVYGIVGRRIPSTWELSMRYIVSGQVNPQPLFTHHLPMDDIDHAMELMRDGRCGKIVLEPFA